MKRTVGEALDRKAIHYRTVPHYFQVNGMTLAISVRIR